MKASLQHLSVGVLAIIALAVVGGCGGGGSNTTVSEDGSGGTGVSVLRAWAVGFQRSEDDPHSGNSFILATMDGGQTWIEQSIPPGLEGTLSGVTFVNESEGWVVGGAGGASGIPMGEEVSPVILHTTNGGTTWVLQRVPPVGIGGRLNAVTFLDRMTGWAVGWKEKRGLLGTVAPLILHTPDSGSTWVEVDPGFTMGSSLGDIAFPTPSDGWVIGRKFAFVELSRALLLHSADGGMTWIQQDFPPTVDIIAARVRDLAFPTAQEGWVLGNPVLHTSDGGATWVDQTAAVAAAVGEVRGVSLDAVTFASPSEGWIVGGLILHTSDGGASWVQQPFPPGRLMAVSFANAREGWAVGEKLILGNPPLPNPPRVFQGTPSPTMPVLVATFCVVSSAGAGLAFPVLGLPGPAAVVLPATVELNTLPSGTQQLTWTVAEEAHISVGISSLVREAPFLPGVTFTGILSDCDTAGLCTFSTVDRAGTPLGPDTTVVLSTGNETCTRLLLDEEVTGTINLQTGAAELFLDLTALVTNVPCPAEGEPDFFDALDLMIPLTTGESRLAEDCPGGGPAMPMVEVPFIVHTTDGGNTWVDQSENIQGEREGRVLTAVTTAPAR